MTGLLTRDEFREFVFKRDFKTCVMCSNPAVDAHHIIDRKQFIDGGYYLNNGVRKGHVQTDEHWTTQKIESNKLI